MKLAFCLYKFFPYGGLERDFLRISRICFERGHSIDVYTMSWEGEKPENYNIHVIPITHWTNHGRNKLFVRKLKALLSKESFDAVIGFNKMPGLDVYYAADPCYAARISQSKPALFRLTCRYRHYQNFERAVFDRDSHTELMMISDIEQAKYQSCYNTQPERFHLLPPGISPDRKAPANATEIRRLWRNEFNVADDEKVVLMVGSAFKRKGVDRALLALAALPGTIRNKTRLFVIGKDDPKPFIQLAKKLGVEERLTFFLGRDDVPRFLLGCDLFTHPAYTENTGTVILEAVVAGLPVLITDTCGYAFHVARSNAGLIAESPFDQASFNQQLEYMLTSSECKTWSENGIKYSQTEDLYSLPTAAADLIEAVGKRLAKS